MDHSERSKSDLEDSSRDDLKDNDALMTGVAWTHATEGNEKKRARRQDGDADEETRGNEKGKANDIGGESDASSINEKKQRKKKRKVHKLSLDKTHDLNAALLRRGVIYVARIPPRMTPTKIKSLLQDFGEVTRVYLVEEDAAVRRRRRKLSGNSSKRYTEGWVEFASKKVAKHVAKSLHMTPMSNYKRSHHYDDLWNLKYLHKFQWSFLTEKVAYERRVREQKLRLETMQARRETAAYKQLVETGQKLDKIQERKQRRAQREAAAAGKNGQEKAAAAVECEKDTSNERQQGHERRKPQVRPMDEGTGQTSRLPLLGSLV